MKRRAGQWAGLAAALAILLAATGPAQAQDTRDALFRALLENPADTDLMLRYARASVAERDYEAAIGTLERLVDLDPANQEARYELALAYFALGADEVARYHLEIYRSRGDLTAAEAQAAGRYADSAENRGSDLSVSGFVEAGLIVEKDEDGVGLTYGLGVNADLDLPGAGGAVLENRLILRGYTFPERTEDNQSILLLRSGPSIPVGGSAQGPRLKPFLELQITEDNDDFDDGTSLSLGLEYRHPLENGVTLDLAAQHGTIDRDGLAFDSEFTAARLGGSYRAGPNTSVGLSFRYLNENADPGGIDRERSGLRAALRQKLPGTALGMENWSLRGFARFDRENYQFNRSDDILVAGVTLRTYFRPESFVRLSARVFDRSSSVPIFDDTDTLVALDVGMEF